MSKKIKSQKAFTLIEILIALVIFSIAMVIASGVFSNILGSQSLVAVSTSVNNEGQRILRQISDDTINATSVGTTNIPGGQTNAKGILFLKSDGSVAKLSTDIATGFVLFSPNGLKIYQYDASGKTIKYGVNKPTNQTAILNQLQFVTTSVPPTIDLSKYDFSTLNNPSVEISAFSLSGFFCYNSAGCSQQPYIKIDMVTETAGYATKAARHRASIELRTMITGRSY
jgi:prepilin-type N-terminal cleavage/methylation domain-containing protein